MTKSLSGTAGCQFSITTVDTSTTTGSSTVKHETEIGIRSVTYSNTSISAALAGIISSSATVVDLSALNSADALYLQDATAPIAFTSILTIVVHNKDLSNPIWIQPSDSFFDASMSIYIQPNSAVQLTFPYPGKTVDGTHKTFILTALAAVSVNTEVYILGN